jgi:hypothetical protein
MRNSMLAMGACERVKKIARGYPTEVANSAIMDELVVILKDGPATALGGSVMQALSIMALNPEGRQRVCLAGAAAPLIKCVGVFSGAPRGSIGEAAAERARWQ